MALISVIFGVSLVEPIASLSISLRVAAEIVETGWSERNLTNPRQPTLVKNILLPGLVLTNPRVHNRGTLTVTDSLEEAANHRSFDTSVGAVLDNFSVKYDYLVDSKEGEILVSAARKTYSLLFSSSPTEAGSLRCTTRLHLKLTEETPDRIDGTGPLADQAIKLIGASQFLLTLQLRSLAYINVNASVTDNIKRYQPLLCS